MTNYLLVKASKAILSPQHTTSATQVLIDQDSGKIVQIGDKIESPKDASVQVLTLEHDQLLMPGLVDAHGKFFFVSGEGGRKRGWM